MTADKIRALYPNPQSSGTVRRPFGHQEYCIGGALCQYLNSTSTYPWYTTSMQFPAVYTISFALREANPHLSRT